MNTIQELVSRARMLFQGSPKRRQTFDLVNGKRSAKEISRRSGRVVNATLNELQQMKDLELVQLVMEDGKPLKKDGSLVYEKIPLIKHLSTTYFDKPEKLPSKPKVKSSKSGKVSATLRIPTEQEILDICKGGEDQLYEFKAAGAEMKTLSKEICAFANTSGGGLLFYGVEDDGTIDNSDQSRQKFDQSLQNSVRNMISPPLSVRVVEKEVVGHKILVIAIPPWDRKHVYHFDGRVYIRKGTNAFSVKPEESKLLHAGRIVV
jgi:Putative DNA-binding domain